MMGMFNFEPEEFMEAVEGQKNSGSRGDATCGLSSE
jgi:hypothetical protein